MDDVIRCATDLAEAIKTSERYRQMRLVESRVEGNEEVRHLLEDFEKAKITRAEKESQGEPVEVEEKRELARLEEQVKGNTELQELLGAQADYYEMMNRVNATIQSVLSGDGEG
jgi:cell fate (sporulation/competence/biofilm development) regulator YlbF (YheA/YmcA/DUF963 family)